MKRLMPLSTAILMTCKVVQASCIHCEDYGIVWKNGVIESAAGFKFGSAPAEDGRTDVVLELDKPLRHFTMLHLGYYSNRLHTVSFMGFPGKEMQIEAPEKELEILKKQGFCGWQGDDERIDVPVNNGKDHKSYSLSGRFTWFGVSNCIDIVYAERAKSILFQKELLTVVFIDRNVKRHLGDVDDSPKKEPYYFLSDYYPHYVVCDLREICGTGRLSEYYFQCPMTKAEQMDAEVILTRCSEDDIGVLILPTARPVDKAIYDRQGVESVIREVQDSLLKEDECRPTRAGAKVRRVEKKESPPAVETERSRSSCSEISASNSR